VSFKLPKISAEKLVLISALYISQSVPVSFLKTGFQLVLNDQNLENATVTSLMGLLLLPWTLKLLWAPFVDRYGSKRIGHRKSWIIPLQLAGAGVLVIAAFLPLESSMIQITLLFLIYSLICATQDIAVDGLTVLSLSKRQHGIGNSIQMGGYYLGELLGGAVILILFDQYGWTVSILALAALFLTPLIPVARYKEPHCPVDLDNKPSFASINSFFKQEEGWWVVLLVLYMGNQILAKTLLPTMLADQGMGKGDIGMLTGVWGNSASFVGAVLGGLLINKIGRKQSLIGYGLIKIPVIYLIIFIGQDDTSVNLTRFVILINEFISGLATVTLFTIMMDKCRNNSPGTDFTIQQSVNSIGILIFVIMSGAIRSYLGHEVLVVTATLLALISATIAWKGLNWNHIQLKR